MEQIILNKNHTPESIYSTYTERKVARVVVVKDGNLLLIHSTKYNSYTLPGGGVEAGETLEQAAIREAREETGMDISIIRPLGTTVEVFDGKQILNISTGFLAQVEDEHDLTPDPEWVEDGQELVWVAIGEAIALIESVNPDSRQTSMLREVFFIQQFLAS